MKLFHDEKGNEMKQKYWLAENGTVRCLDDRCPQECDMGCPIYLNTLAIECLQSDHFKEAAGYLEKAIVIEPTFAEAWNNLAACYGQMGYHQKAFDAYLKSYELLAKPKPLYGMAVAMKNLGQLTQATQYAKLYEKKYGSDEMISSVLADIAEKKMEQDINKETAQTHAKNTAATNQGTTDQQDSDTVNVMREYGRLFLLLMDEDTREEGYAEIEKLESRFPEAGIVLGQYYQGSDPEEAEKHFKIAADAKIAEGQWGYSQLLPHSYVLDFSDADDKEYLKYCLAAAEGGCPDAANEMGNICHRKGVYAESTYWYGMAYSLEHPSGMISLRGITKEWQQKGFSKEFKAHIDGFTQDRRDTASIIYRMFTSSLKKEDLDEMMALALHGENLAGFILAQIMEQHKQDDMAYEVYNTLVFEKHPYALRCYADMILNGKGTERDVNGAFRMYELAAKGGNAEAMFAMGQKAVKEGDRYLAACWFGQAYVRGMNMAGEWLAKLAKN